MYIVQCTRTILYMYKIVHVQIVHAQIVNVKIVHDAMQSGQSLTATVNHQRIGCGLIYRSNRARNGLTAERPCPALSKRFDQNGLIKTV